MKNYLILLLGSILFMSCKPSEDIKLQNTSNISSIIDSLLSSWHRAAANADLETYFEFMDSVSVYLGTDASENWSKDEFHDFCKPYFERKTTWNFTAIERNIFIGKNAETAWFDEVLDTHMGLCRGSGVLEMNKKEWKIKQYVLSVAIPNENMQSVISLKHTNDSIYLNSNPNK